jgi:DNA-binding transcriptional regulator YbjK
MPTRAQLTQDRSRQRRDDLLAAATELFAEGGTRAVTHRAVAARAGLPPATTTYYFASIEELLREALAAHIRQWSSDLADLTSLVPEGPNVSLEDASSLMSHAFRQRGPEVAALELSIFLAATRDPALRESATEALRLFEGLAVQVLTRLGVDGAEALGASIIALIAGTAVRRQSGQYTDDEEARLLTAAVRDLIAAHVLGGDAVSEALRP